MMQASQPETILPSPPDNSHVLVPDDFAHYLTLHGNAKAAWLWSHRSEVGLFYQRNGRAAALRQYRVRLPTLKRLLGEQTPYDPEHGVSGDKAKWNRDHAEDILFYYDQNGAKATRKHFRLHKETLERMLRAREQMVNPRIIHEYTTQSAVEVAEKSRLIAMAAQASAAEVRREVRELRETFGLFQQEISRQLAALVFEPMLRRLNGTDGGSAGHDALAIAGGGSHGPTGELSQDGARGSSGLLGQGQPGSEAGGGSARARSGRAGLLGRGPGAGERQHRALPARLPVRREQGESTGPNIAWCNTQKRAR